MKVFFLSFSEVQSEKPLLTFDNSSNTEAVFLTTQGTNTEINVQDKSSVRNIMYLGTLGAKSDRAPVDVVKDTKSQGTNTINTKVRCQGSNTDLRYRDQKTNTVLLGPQIILKNEVESEINSKVEQKVKENIEKARKNWVEDADKKFEAEISKIENDFKKEFEEELQKRVSERVQVELERARESVEQEINDEVEERVADEISKERLKWEREQRGSLENKVSEEIPRERLKWEVEQKKLNEKAVSREVAKEKTKWERDQRDKNKEKLIEDLSKEKTKWEKEHREDLSKEKTKWERDQREKNKEKLIEDLAKEKIKWEKEIKNKIIKRERGVQTNLIENSPTRTIGVSEHEINDILCEKCLQPKKSVGCSSDKITDETACNKCEERNNNRLITKTNSTQTAPDTSSDASKKNVSTLTSMTLPLRKDDSLSGVLFVYLIFTCPRSVKLYTGITRYYNECPCVQ